ncbi:MAG: hypothetical protein SOV71_02810 [Anaerovoracaceae bacterium]|nr:hypothetical protein [Bacillota bacterium]MDY2670465.1 hypothetical protein [Anaerovoracaceae bacterium]
MTDSFEKFRQQDDERVNEQIEKYLPMIELERSAYIQAEYGRLMAVMGTAYIGEDGNDVIFHEPEEEVLNAETPLPGDPYQINLDELVEMTGWQKKIYRLGTWSYTRFYNARPEDRERLKLLRSMWNRLMDHQLCTDLEIKALVSGHDDYIKSKTSYSVKVIM